MGLAPDTVYTLRVDVVDFDHVRLDAVPVGFVPWPGWSAAALALALAAGAALRLRRRH